MRTLTSLIGFSVGGALALTALSAQAQDYPQRPVTLVVPFSAGGTTDIVARIYAAELSEELGQPVPVVNIVGGGGALANNDALDSEGGHKILMATSGNHILTPLASDVGYTPEDYTPIGQLSMRTLVLAAGADAPWETLTDLQEDAAENPGAYTFGAVPSVLPFLTVAAWMDAAGVELTHVPQQGGAPGVTGVLGGHLDLVPESLSSVMQHLDSGAMRGLAVFNEERDPLAPDIPTAAEQGFEIYGNPFTGVAVSTDAPEEAVERLREATARIVEDPEFQERMEQAGETIVYLDGEAFGEVWARDWEAYASRFEN